MNNRLYVGNLNYDTTDDKLREVFSELGPVQDATVITDRYSGRSRGFGFVEMADESTAAQAIEKLNETEIDGRTVKVAEAKPRPTSRDTRRDDRREDRSTSFDRW